MWVICKNSITWKFIWRRLGILATKKRRCQHEQYTSLKLEIKADSMAWTKSRALQAVTASKGKLTKRSIAAIADQLYQKFFATILLCLPLIELAQSFSLRTTPVSNESYNFGGYQLGMFLPPSLASLSLLRTHTQLFVNSIFYVNGSDRPYKILTFHSTSLYFHLATLYHCDNL